MKNENGISEELISMGSSLAGYSRTMPYSVPEGFFENTGENIQQVIRYLSEPDVVPVWSKALPFSVPNGYFEELTGNIVGAVTVDDITSALPKKSIHQVPSGYFEALPAQILGAAKASEQVLKEPKIIPLKPRIVRNPIRWAAAAVMLMCIGLGFYESFYSRQQANPDKILGSVTNTDIQDYLQGTYRLDVDRVVADNNISNLDVNSKDIVQYLNETGWDQTE